MLTKLQQRGLGVSNICPEDPLIWNPLMAVIFKSVDQCNLDFQLGHLSFLTFSRRKNRYQSLKHIRICHILQASDKPPSQIFMSKLSAVLEAYFHLEVIHDIKPFLITKELKIQDQSNQYEYSVKHNNQQFKAVQLLSVLIDYSKEGEEILLGLIHHGLSEGKNSISGRALGNGVAVVDVTSWRTKQGLTEIFSTSVHQIMHTLGLDHCTYWRCLMNPLTNEEIIMCPVCLKKFHSHAVFDIKERYGVLERALKEAGMTKGATKCRKLLKTFEGVER